MGCCGKKVEQFRAGAPSLPPGKTARLAGPRVVPAVYDRAIFEYIGNTGMTVVGPASGKRYRFERPGARLEVDLRDRRALAAVPHLRQMMPR